MSGQFKVGEVLVGQRHTLHKEFNGMECVVREGLAMRFFRNIGETEVKREMRYRVEWANGLVTATLPEKLRRKQPPAGEQSIMDMFKLLAPSKAKEAA